MRFLIEFDKKLEENSFQVSADLDQTVEQLLLLVSLNYNNIDSVYLEFQGKALTMKKQILSEVVNNKTQPIQILVRQKGYDELAAQKMSGIRENIENNAEDIKKYVPVIGIVLAILFLFWIA